MRNRFEDRIAKVKVPAKEGFNGGYIRVNGKKVDIYLTNIKQVNTGITISTEVTVIDSIEISPDSLNFDNGVTAYDTIVINPDSLNFDNGVTAYHTIEISPDSLDFGNGVTAYHTIEISPDSLDFGNGVTAYNTISMEPDSLDFGNGVTAYNTIEISPDSLNFGNGVTAYDTIVINPDSLNFDNGVTAYNTISMEPDSLDFGNGVTAYHTIEISPDSLNFDNGRDMTIEPGPEQEDKNLYNGTVTVGFDGSAAGYNTGEKIDVTGYTNGTWGNVQQSEGAIYATSGNLVHFQISRGSKINFVFQYKDANSIWFRAVMGSSGGDTGESNKVSVNGTITQNMTCTITGTTIVLADYLAEN